MDRYLSSTSRVASAFFTTKAEYTCSTETSSKPYESDDESLDLEARPNQPAQYARSNDNGEGPSGHNNGNLTVSATRPAVGGLPMSTFDDNMHHQLREPKDGVQVDKNEDTLQFDDTE